MNIPKHKFKIYLVYLLLSFLVILGTTLVSTPSVSADTVKVYTKGNLQTGFGPMLQPLSTERQFSDEFNNIINSWCGSANGINNSPENPRADRCAAAIRKDPICTAITNPETFTECVQAVAYKFFGGNKFSSFRYPGYLTALLNQSARNKINKTSSSEPLQLSYYQQEPIQNPDSYTEAKQLSTNKADLSLLQYPIDSYSTTARGVSGYYKTYWEGCSPYIPWRPEDNEYFRNTIFCETAESNRNNEIKLFLEFPDIDYSQATLSLCANPERTNNSNTTPYSKKCVEDIIKNCFFNDQTPFDECANKYRTSVTTTITQSQLTKLTTQYCQKYLLTSGDSPSAFINSAYLACLKESQEECKTDTAGGIQAYGQCVKKIAYEKMATVSLCLAGENEEKAVTCSLRICKPNDKAVEQCKSAQGITRLESCIDKCPTGEVLCKGPITGATNTDPAPSLYCYKPAAGQRPAAGTGAAGRPAAGANNAAAGKVGNCYSCQTTGGVTKWDKVGLTQMSQANCTEDKLNESNNRSGIKYTGEPTWVDSAGENTGRPPEKPASCQVTAVSTYDCFVCTKGATNTWGKAAGEKLTEAACLAKGGLPKKIETTNPVRNTTTRSNANYCPTTGNIGVQASGAALPASTTIGCKVNAYKKSSTGGAATVEFTGGANNSGFDRVNWYLGTSINSLEFKGTNRKVSGETTFGIPPESTYQLNPDTDYFVQAEFYTEEGDNKRDALPCAVGQFKTDPPPNRPRALKSSSDQAQVVLGNSTGPYAVGFYVKAGSEDVTELNVTVKAYDWNGQPTSVDASGLVDGTAQNKSVVRVNVNDQVRTIVVSTSYTFEGQLVPGATTSMNLNRLNDSQASSVAPLQQTPLKPLEVQTIRVSPPKPTSSGFVLVTTTSTISLGNSWKIQVEKDGQITAGNNASAETLGCENNLGGVCTYQADFSRLPEGDYRALLLSGEAVKASAEFKVVASSSLDQAGNPITPTIPAAPGGGAPSQIELIPDEVKLSCSSGEFVIYQNGSPITQTVTMNSDEEICRLIRYLNGSLLDSSDVKFKVGAREEPAAAPGTETPGNDKPEGTWCDEYGQACGNNGTQVCTRKWTSDGQCVNSNECGPCEGEDSGGNSQQEGTWCDEYGQACGNNGTQVCTRKWTSDGQCVNSNECGPCEGEDAEDPNKCSPSDNISDNGGGTFWYCDGEGKTDPRTYCWGPTDIEGSGMWGNPDNSCLPY